MSRFHIDTSRLKRGLKSKTVVALGIVIVLLVAARAALPYVVEYYVDKKLDELEGYSGAVRDVDLNLWRGAYEIEGVRIVKTGGRVPVPFFRGRNLTNSEDLSGSLVSTFQGKALAMKSGRIELKGRFNPYADEPTFELDLALNDLDVRQLNDYLRAYGNVDAEAGTFSMDAEFAASRGRLNGYVKPFIDDLDVLRWKEEGESLPNKLWQGLVEVVTEVLEDRPKERIATKIPFEGTLKNPDADTWSIVGGLLKNAFIEALRRGIEGSIGISRKG